MLRTSSIACVLALSTAAAAQLLELPKTTERMEAVAEDGSAVAHLCVVVDGAGRRYVRTAGHADVEADRPFEDWMLVPIGRLTRAVTLAGFDDACARGALSRDARIGDTVEGLQDAAAAVTWDALLGEEAGGFPCYLRYVPPDAEPRALAAVLRAHAFLPVKEKAWRDPSSMTPWALMQAALEDVDEAPWPEIVGRIASEHLGMSGVRDARGAPEHMLVRRHRTDGAPVGRWLAEVPAADGAVVSGSDLVRLLGLAHDEERAAAVLRDWGSEVAEAFGQTFREWRIAVPGASGSLRFYEELDLAVFTFVARAGDRTATELHESVLSDVLPAAQDVDEVFEIGLGGGVADEDRTVVGRWKGALRRLDEEFEVELDVGLRRSVRVRVGGEDGEFYTSNELRRWGAAVRGAFRSARLAPDGLEQRTRLMLAFDGEALVGFAVLEASHPELGKVESLPCPVRFERVEDR